MANITIETPSYNEKRYGKPYIGTVDPVTGRVIKFGRWIGEVGRAGMLEIDVEAGAIVMHGQKDHRGNNGDPTYAVVQADGSLLTMSKVEAVKAARAHAQSASATAQPSASIPDEAATKAAAPQESGASKTVKQLAAEIVTAVARGADERAAYSDVVKNNEMTYGEVSALRHEIHLEMIHRLRKLQSMADDEVVMREARAN